MTGTFEENRRYIEHEYQEPHWDEASGLPPEKLSEELTRFIDSNLNLPMPILRARAFEFFIDNVQIEINPHTPFADKLNAGIDYSDYAGQDLFANAMYHRFHREVLSEKMPEEFAKRNLAEELGICTADADFWHTLPEWPCILELGFPGLLKRAEDRKNELLSRSELTHDQEIFFDSVIISYRAIIKYVERLYTASLSLDIPEYTECLRSIMTAPPKNLYEVMELSIIFMNMEEIGVERARSTGRIDQMYYPYYVRDIKSGTFTDDEVKELLRYFYMKFQAARRYADQPFSICGVKENGEDATNKLTYLLLDAYDGLGVHNPKIHVCCHPDMPEKLLNRVLDLIRRGNSSFCLINGEVVVKGYEKIGIGREEAQNYVPFGCYEPILMGKEEPMIGASWLNMAKAAELAMNGGFDMRTGVLFGLRTPDTFTSYEDFRKTVFNHLRYFIEFTENNILEQDRYHMLINPSPIYSGSLTTCIEKGRDIFNGGTKYHNTSIKCCGIATLVDSLLMVKKFVFEDGIVSFDELKNALLCNWEGYEKLRLMIRRCPLRYGNHIEEADTLAHDIYKFAASLIVGKKNHSGGVFRMGCDSITNCIIFGQRMGPTPDGRLDGDATSKNFCAVNGMDRRGITALIESVCTLDSADFVNGAVTDFILHPTMVQGEAGLAAMRSMVKTYFEHGGYTLQGNVMDINMLLDAQKNPDRYRTLQVRVCGWNEYFVEMAPEVQNEFIYQLQEV